MAWTLSTSGACIAKAGANASSITSSGSVIAQWSNEAEGRIVAETRRDWVTDYSSLSTGLKNMLSDVSSSMVAKQIVTYDMTGYTRAEAQTILDVQDDIIRTGISLLKDFKSNTIKST